jgi:hypothetical protein
VTNGRSSAPFAEEADFFLRQRTSGCGGVKGLGAGAGAGRGGDAGFCVPSLAIVPAICCWLPASRSTLCCKLASAAGISLSFSNSCFSPAKSSFSCCSSGEAVACEAAAVCSGAACGTDAVSGANEASCGQEVAIIALAASPYHCQANVAPTPIENTIRKRTRRRDALLRSDGRISSGAEPAIASSSGRPKSGWSAASRTRKRPPTLASSPSTSAAHRPRRASDGQRAGSGNQSRGPQRTPGPCLSARPHNPETRSRADRTRGGGRRRKIGQRDHRANTGNRHQAPAHIIVPDERMGPARRGDHTTPAGLDIRFSSEKGLAKDPPARSVGRRTRPPYIALRRPSGFHRR